MDVTIDGSREGLFSQGSTTVFAYPADPRFAFCLYVPPPSPNGTAPGLVVGMHGTGRAFMEYRDRFASFGERHNQVILAPLFPAGVAGDGNVDGYKYLLEGTIRYDQVLLGMVDEVARRTGCVSERFCLFGFSGGGHFVHRFLLLHPGRLRAASIGAPGQVTLLDPATSWWAGVSDLAAVFGRTLDLPALRQVPVQMIVGAEDTETWEIAHKPGSRYWRAEAAHAGAHRVERLRSLQRSFEAEGVSVRFDLMPGRKHDSAPAAVLAQDFFQRHLTS